MDDRRPISDIIEHIDEMKDLLVKLLAQYDENGHVVHPVEE